MLIGNNTNFNNDNNNFNNKMRAIKQNTENNIIQNNDTNIYKNISNTNESTDKAFQILKDRLDNGLITLDEFNKKCNKINKTRN